METLIKQAIEKYEAHEAVREAGEKARQQLDQEAAEREREEMRQFLAALMPAELVQHAVLEDYRRADAEKFRSEGSSGTVITVRPPGCFPVRLRVYASRDELCHERERWSHDGPFFSVNTNAQIRPDEYGDDGYFIEFSGQEWFEDFMTALGYAAVRGPELIPLQAEIEACKEGDKINNEYVREAEAGLREMQEKRTPQERIAGALENIANGIAALHLYGA